MKEYLSSVKQIVSFQYKEESSELSLTIQRLNSDIGSQLREYLMKEFKINKVNITYI